jgi:hypothetical protein
MVTEKCVNCVTKMRCENCDYTCSRKYEFDRHCLAAKHLQVTQKTQNCVTKMRCEPCDYTCSRKYDFDRHCLAAKHLQVTQVTQCVKKCVKKCVNPDYACKKCKKIYKSRNGLWVHNKTCIIVEENIKEDMNLILDASLNQIEHLSNIVIDMVKQNQEFKQLLVDQNKQMLELANKPTITNNNTMNNNNTTNFNLNFFLNETCKDAMNLTDFVDSLVLTLKDLETTGKLGYEEGISQIFIKGLRDLDISKRPIHCSDVKREKLYVRNSNIWEKDQEQEHLRKAVRKVANKNVNQIMDWITANPESQNYHSKKNDQYLQIVLKSTGGSTKEEEEKRIGKVITNIAKHVELDKKIVTPGI